ncbi:intradiol ring-cleavage dioxygenase [Arenibaculum sp.]|uniref:dioxygenase family protein n=1 Tax=Arenibaculum sp. TaxID=2865862 RepID=UPI002E101B68|nr:intradiol ring-cleavage dioxygenase [Arenibaculum sp.]
MADGTKRMGRRGVIAAAAAAPLLWNLSAGARALRAATPCGAGATPPNPEGPFYSPDSPRRQSLRDPGMAGVPIVVTGVVLSPECRPLPGAVLDFWQADADGAYDTAGYRLRGHQFADENGRYRLETILPGNYGPRTRHIHVTVLDPGMRPLTTQLYFPGEPRNRTDPLYRPGLLVSGDPAGRGELYFDFLLARE